MASRKVESSFSFLQNQKSFANIYNVTPNKNCSQETDISTSMKFNYTRSYSIHSGQDQFLHFPDLPPAECNAIVISSNVSI